MLVWFDSAHHKSKLGLPMLDARKTFIYAQHAELLKSPNPLSFLFSQIWAKKQKLSNLALFSFGGKTCLPG
jgi:hypothetical protein